MKPREKAMLQKLEAERARLNRQIEALQNEVRGLDRAIALCSSDTAVVKERPRNVKATVLKIVEDAGNVGMNVDEVVTAARNVGTHLEKATVASNLSRLKADGVFEVREGRYVFRARPSEAGNGFHAAGLPLTH